MKEAIKLRHEQKHIVSSGEDRILASRLKKLFLHDKHADAHGIYRVHSLYFDTPYDKALRQKLDGVNLREKFRLRYYGEDLSFIRLEKKFKTNRLCGKRSAKVTREQVQKIFLKDIDFLLESGHPLMQEFYSKLKGQQLSPKALVTYDREAFLFLPGNVRITLDRNIRTGNDPMDFLDPLSPRTLVDPGTTVLEVKYDEFLPEIVKMAVQAPNTMACAYSKYAVCRKYD